MALIIIIVTVAIIATIVVLIVAKMHRNRRATKGLINLSKQIQHQDSGLPSSEVYDINNSDEDEDA